MKTIEQKKEDDSEPIEFAQLVLYHDIKEYPEINYCEIISKLQIVERFEILQPCFTNNEVMHSVENLSTDYRVMFTVRWILDPTLGRQIDEVIDTTDLFV